MARKTGSRSEITGLKVKAAALKLFAAHGYAAVSMRQIAKEVGVQAGALYAYTKDKQELLFDLMQAHMIEGHAAWKAEGSSDDPLEQLDIFSRFQIRYHLTRADQLFVCNMELRNLTPDNFRKIEELRRTFEQDLKVILDAGVAAGQFAIKDTKVASMAIIGMLTSLSSWFDPSGRLNPEEMEAIYVNMVRRTAGARALVEV